MCYSYIKFSILQNSEIALTALVVVTLSETLEFVAGSMRTASAIAIQRAVKYLEKSLNSLTDIYQLSITTYALTLVMSGEMEYAYTLLYQKRKQNNGLYMSKIFK